MDSDFQSLNKGIFVVPFNPDASRPGPSRRPLKPVYDATYDRYLAAYQYYEEGCIAEQLDDVADWLDRCNTPPLLKQTIPIHRLPVAIIQNIAPSLPDQLHELGAYVFTLDGRDAPDLASATRAVAVGFVGEAALAAKKTGRTGMDEVERWWEKQRGHPPLLLHIQQAQLVPSAVLAELTYILTLRPNLPIRLLLSVPSTSAFIAGWTHVEPSAIDLSVLGSGRAKRRVTAVNAILKVATDGSKVPLALSEEVAEELRRNEELTNGGAAAVLKALKWILLHHSFNSPLARLSADGSSVQRIQAAVEAKKTGSGISTSDEDLLMISQTPDLASVLNPAARISVLHGLSQPESFIQASKRRRLAPTATETTNGHDHGPGENGHVVADPDQESAEEFRELKTLFALWRGAGKSVNLWDWLDGFRHAMVEEKDAEVRNGGVDGDGDVSMNGHGKRKRAIEGESGGYRDQNDIRLSRGEAEGEGEEGEDDEDEGDEEEQARLHATFIRFCEEARMMGLVRARGKGAGRRGDEVVKGIGMV